MYTSISESVDAYNEMLDEIHPEIEIAGITLSPSRVLNECDPCAYKCGWIDWCDSQDIDTDDLIDDYEFDWDRR